MNLLGNIFTPDLVRLIMLGVFLAFMVFFIIYGSFGIFHAVKFGTKGDLTKLSVVIFSLVSIILFTITFLLLLT